MLRRERHDAILDIVERQGYVRIADLVEELGSSESTVRRDLGALHRESRLVRTHGGAYSHRSDNVPLAERVSDDRDTKLAIARRAVGLVRDGTTIYVDGGSTTGCMAECLSGRQLTLVTNSLTIASRLEMEPQIDVILVGGNLYPGQGVVVGPLARSGVQHFAFEAVFLGARGIADGTVWNANEVFTGLPRLLVEQPSAKRVLLAGSHKLGQRAPVAICPLSKLDVLVTDGDPTHPCLDGWDGDVCLP